MTERTLAHGQDVGRVPPAAPRPGAIGTGYRLERPLGEGGMAEVWLAEQTTPVRRQVAVKLIKAGMDSRRVLARFEAERQTLALMVHPAIAKLYDGGSTPEDFAGVARVEPGRAAAQDPRGRSACTNAFQRQRGRACSAVPIRASERPCGHKARTTKRAPR